MSVPDEVIRILKGIKEQNSKVETTSILLMLKATLLQFENTFVCIDALDELSLQTRNELLASLKDELSSTRLFLTGREHIRDEVRSRFKCTAAHNEVVLSANAHDIEKYLRYKVKQDKEARPSLMNEKLEEEIISAIVGQSKGMYVTTQKIPARVIC